MAKLHLFRSHSLIKIILLASLIPVIAVFSMGCGYKVYEAKIDDVEYSFKYRENDHIYQENYHMIVPLPGYGENPYWETHINIKTEAELNKISNSQRIDNFIFTYNYNISGFNDVIGERSQYFGVIERSAIEIDGLEAEYITYYFLSFFIGSYEGKFLTFTYKDVAFEVNILSKEGNSDTEEAFNLFVQTFKIKD